MKVTKHIELLGRKVTDKVTGFQGVISTMSFDLYGCVQAVVSPPVNEAGEKKAGEWFDITRLDLSDEPRVMELPDFSEGYIVEGKKGCADKPLP